jgi:hypothetical protein
MDKITMTIDILKKASNFCGEQGGDICESIDEDISKAIQLLEAKNERNPQNHN